MAIDYKKEWEKLRANHGTAGMVSNPDKTILSLGKLMDKQISVTISKREKLMKQYLISGMETDITGASQYCHSVNVGFHKNIYGNVSISKEDFNAWCKKKGGK